MLKKHNIFFLILKFKTIEEFETKNITEILCELSRNFYSVSKPYNYVIFLTTISAQIFSININIYLKILLLRPRLIYPICQKSYMYIYMTFKKIVLFYLGRRSS